MTQTEAREHLRFTGDHRVQVGEPWIPSKLSKTMGGNAGLAGIAFGVLLLIFQGVLQQKFLPSTGLDLSKLDTWFEYLVEYRDALAHRIPLYIPPGGVRPALVDA